MKKTLKRVVLVLCMLLLAVAGHFLLIKKLDQNALNAPNERITAGADVKSRQLPCKFIAGERFYLKLPVQQGDTLLAFCDTGGGICMVMPASIEKLKVVPVHTGLVKGVMSMDYVLFRDLLTDPAYPAPLPARHMLLRRPYSRVSEPHLIIPPMEKELQFMSKVMTMDAFLGQNFFMGKSWTIDYPNKQVWVNTPLTADNDGVQTVGLKRNADGEALFGHVSMLMEVSGEKIPVLFDTGATIVLSESGKQDFGTQEKTIGGSFIAASVFDRWKKDYPEWRVFTKADFENDVIEVPEIGLGGHAIGPVLFARRPDENWSEGMIHTMDTVVKGAIGGSALKYLKVEIDYNSALIRFNKSGEISVDRTVSLQ